MKIPDSVYVIHHTRACGDGITKTTVFKTLLAASRRREKWCFAYPYQERRPTDCRLVRYDRQEKP